MPDRTTPRVLVAHQRPPVQRLLRTNLRADGFAALGASSPATTLTALRAHGVDALVLDAELIKGDRPESADLLRFLLAGATPTLLISWDPTDRLLARSLRDAPFLSRPDDVDEVLQHVRALTAPPVPVAR
jgi:DNA-binding response OmpR family regulator